MNKGVITTLLVVIIVVLLGFYFIDIDLQDEGEMPDVNVNVEEGEMPEADVNTGSVDVGTEETTVEVPTVDVEPAEEADESEEPEEVNDGATQQ